MKEELFDELCESVKQAEALMRAEPMEDNLLTLEKFAKWARENATLCARRKCKTEVISFFATVEENWRMPKYTVIWGLYGEPKTDDVRYAGDSLEKAIEEYNILSSRMYD